MTLPPIPPDLSPPVSSGAPGTSNLPSEFSIEEDKRRSEVKETKRASMLNRAGRSAFQRLNGIIGDEPDKDVQFYESLSQDDFSRLTSIYGQDDVARYVRAMEKKRLNRS